MKSVYSLRALYLIFLAALSAPTQCLSEEAGDTNIFKAHSRIAAETTYPKKPITVLLYGSARNDLLPFIDRNLKQLMQVGTNDNITFLVHLDVFGQGRKKLTQRYIIMKNQMVQVGSDMSMDSGDAATLLDACTWAFSRFPSERTMLILWNHGTGDLEPSLGRAINSIELFKYNPDTNLIELNRSINFFDYLNEQQIRNCHRGICFDESTGHYLTNQQVGATLRTICNTCLNGRPLDVLLCDACLMQGIGVAYSLKAYGQQPVAKYMVGSQEVVLATGYSYNVMFDALAKDPSMSNAAFAEHAVRVFGDTYSKITNDFTQSAINLEAIDPLYASVDRIAQLLISGMQNEASRSVRKFIQRCASDELCTHFEEPTYKDMNHLFSNMLNNLSMITLTNNTAQFQSNLAQELNNACTLLRQVVTSNNAGKGLANARGISIYLPKYRVDASFPHTDFARNSSWLQMISLYVQ